MSTCDTCRWWGDGTEAEDPIGRRFMFCSHPKITGAEDGEDGLSIYHDVDSGILMGPKFGCIHHQAKDSNVEVFGH